MIFPFLVQAAVSPTRQRALRWTVTAHLLVTAVMSWLVLRAPGTNGPLIALGEGLLIAGIVEGAILIGWRLTQLPKSQALEFLLVSPLHPSRLLWAEALVGLGRFALVTLSGLPILAVLVVTTRLDPLDLLPLLIMPFTWGAICGLGLTWWAYEPLLVRRIAEKITMGGIAFYILFGVLIGENLPMFVAQLPPTAGKLIVDSRDGFHIYNPFALMQTWMESPSLIQWTRMCWVEWWTLVAFACFLVRAGTRLKGHFRERHYSPILDPTERDRGSIGSRPLSWWAVRRVMEYSGRINLWLAAAVGVLFALYTVAGDYWPPYLGRQAFELIKSAAGGIPGLTAGLVVLSAVPAAFQYGLWDSSVQDRCRRLELLLLTELDAFDYWEAAAAAAWRRGRGYFMVAVLLWVAALAAGQTEVGPMLAALAAGVVLWSLYFAVGFWAFSRGLQANGLGALLTIGLPLAAFGLAKGGYVELVPLLPPGCVYGAMTEAASWPWLIGLGATTAAALFIARRSLAACDGNLRAWYDLNHGRKSMD
jgi:hypothetical protein